MKAYNPATGWFGKKSVHTVRVTLMQEDHIGHVAYDVYGNCTGADVLDVDYFLETAENLPRTTARSSGSRTSSRLNCGTRVATSCKSAAWIADLRRLIVGMEIVDVRRGERMTREELQALADRYQRIADRAYQNYQESGIGATTPSTATTSGLPMHCVWQPRQRRTIR